MSTPPPMDEAEVAARTRYMLLNLVRIGGIAVAIAGMAGSRGVLPLPYEAGVVLAVAGVLGFFFGPPLLARRWKAQDADG